MRLEHFYKILTFTLTGQANKQSIQYMHIPKHIATAVYCRLTFFAVKIFSYMRGNTEIILLKFLLCEIKRTT